MNEPRFEDYLQLVLLLAFVIPAIFFMLAQQRTLELIHPLNRRMAPKQVWLQLIPAFGLYWQFIVIARISDSIQNELNTPVGESIFNKDFVFKYRPTYKEGIWYAFFICISFIPLSLLQGLAGLAGIVAWIYYWVQLSRYKKKLKERALLLNS